MAVVTDPLWIDGGDGRYAGRYPLAVERHVIAQVGQLLPGITTVTSHARYYSLHSLVFAEAEDRGMDSDATRRLLRRAEVAMAAVSIAHGEVAEHAGFRGVHGADRIGPAVSRGAVDIDDLARDKGYVQAGWGFLGPYTGPEQALGLTAINQRKRSVAGPNSDLAALRSGLGDVLSLCEQTSLTATDLSKNSHLCVCAAASGADGAMLRDVMLPEDTTETRSALHRSQTLRLLLRMTDMLGGVANPEGELRGALVYGPERDDSKVVALEAAAAWTGVSLRNELVAGWRNLWAHLVHLMDDFMPVESLAAEFAGELEEDLGSQTVSQFAGSLPDGLGPDGAVTDAYGTLDAAGLKDAAKLLGRLFIGSNRYGRLEPRVAAYFQNERDERMQQLTPEWMQQCIRDWGGRPLSDFAAWLVQQLVARSQRVALAKASLDTKSGRFKIPTRVFVRDGHVFRDSDESGGGVSLRWGSAFQIMAGLGLVEHSEGVWRVTDLGRAA